MNLASRGYTEPDENKQIELVSVKEYKKLTKYKRAFEILKEKLDLTARECCDKYKKAFKKDYEIVAYSYHTFINKEEYELLEELMSDGKIN